MLTLQAEPSGPRRYRFTGEAHTFHSLSDLGGFYVQTYAAPVRRFLEGRFVFELRRKRYRELMESPEGMAMRMAQANR